LYQIVELSIVVNMQRNNSVQTQQINLTLATSRKPTLEQRLVKVISHSLTTLPPRPRHHHRNANSTTLEDVEKKEEPNIPPPPSPTQLTQSDNTNGVNGNIENRNVTNPKGVNPDDASLNDANPNDVNLRRDVATNIRQAILLPK
jgi:hypothetical protein